MTSSSASPRMTPSHSGKKPTSAQRISFMAALLLDDSTLARGRARRGSRAISHQASAAAGGDRLHGLRDADHAVARDERGQLFLAEALGSFRPTWEDEVADVRGRVENAE